MLYVQLWRVQYSPAIALHHHHPPRPVLDGPHAGIVIFVVSCLYDIDATTVRSYVVRDYLHKLGAPSPPCPMRDGVAVYGWGLQGLGTAAARAGASYSCIFA